MSIVKNGLWVQYSCEDVSFLRSLSDEIDWDRVWDEMMTGGDENGAVKEHGGVQNDTDERYKVCIPMVCFCDIPHTRLGNHAGDNDSTDYGPYAIVLGKKWGRERALNPVSYIVPESDFSVAFQNFEALTNTTDPNHEDWRIRSVFRKLLQFLKPYEDNEKRYYDEREWRYIPGGVPSLYTKSAFEAHNLDKVHSALYLSLDDIECLIVNNASEAKDVKSFLRQDLNGDGDQVPVRTFEEVRIHGVE